MLTKKTRNAMMLEIRGGCAHDHTADEPCGECRDAEMRLEDEEDGLLDETGVEVDESDDVAFDTFLRGEFSDLDIELIRKIELGAIA